MTTYIRSFDGRTLVPLAEADIDLVNYGARVVLDKDKNFIREIKPKEISHLESQLRKQSRQEGYVSIGDIIAMKLTKSIEKSIAVEPPTTFEF